MSKFILQIEQGIALYIGSGIETDFHAHHALEFIFSIDQPFELQTASSKKETYGVLISPNCKHKFIGKEGQYIFIFLDPERIQTTEMIHFFQLSPKKPVLYLPPINTIPSFEELVNFHFFEHTFGIQLQPHAISAVEARILEAIDFIKSNLENEKLSLHKVSTKVYLSTSRFAHLFKEQTGIPFRKYILWCRMQKAVEVLLAGKNFTYAAHAAGFSDSAHFSRTCVSMFGVSPSGILKM